MGKYSNRPLNKTTKYTHITETCNVALRALTKWRLKTVCNYTVAEGYWRIRLHEEDSLEPGLLSVYDQNTLDMWSDVIAKFRKNCGSPVPLPALNYVELKNFREVVTEEMEQYRTLLGRGTYPIYILDEHRCLVGAAIMEKFNQANLVPSEMDDESLEGFLREIDWQSVRDRAIGLVPDYEKFCEWKEEALKHAQKQKDIIAIKLTDFIDDWLDNEKKGKLQWAGHSLKDSSSKKYKYAVWQIRTDLEHRSSKDAHINDYLCYFWTVRSWSSEADQLVIKRDMQRIEDFISWKEKMKEADAAHKKKTGKHMQYDAGDVAGKIETFYKSIETPVHPLQLILKEQDEAEKYREESWLDLPDEEFSQYVEWMKKQRKQGKTKRTKPMKYTSKF